MSPVRVEREGSIATIALTYGPSQEAPNGGGFTAEHGAALAGIWRDLKAESALDAIVVRSEGDNFCPSADCPFEDSWFPAAHELWTPIILAAHGRCSGPGLVLVGQADVVVAATDALLSLQGWASLPYREVAWLQGVLPYGELARLALLGPDGSISAERGAELGIYAGLYRRDGLLAAALAEASVLSQLPRTAVRATKEAIQRGRNLYVRDSARLGQAIAARVPQVKHGL